MSELREVAAAAILRGSTLLAAQRAYPESLRGRWELPGGKIEPGESARSGLARELDEELGVTVRVGERLAGEVLLRADLVLRAYVVELDRGEPRAREHLATRWVTSGEIAALGWVAADTLWLPELVRRLESA